MNIRIDITGSIRTALKYFGEWTRPYHDARPVAMMTTSPRWSSL